MFRISKCETVINLNKAITSHENMILGNASEKAKQTYRDRLEKLKGMGK